MIETSITWLGRLTDNPAEKDWQRLNQVYAKLLTSWCARAGVRTGDCDDIVQEVLMVIVRRVNQFEHRHCGAFRGWIRMILANQLRHYFRKRSTLTCQLPLDEIGDSESLTSRRMDQEHDEFIVRRAMRVAEKDFSATTWAAFEQQVIFGQTSLQAAQTLQISINAATKAKCRVLRRIRLELGESLND